MKIAILKTLLYADLFSYPLYAYQIKQLLITPHRVSMNKVKRDLSQLVRLKKVIKKRGEKLYALPGREDFFRYRLVRSRLSRKKLLRAKRSVLFLRFIPTIRLIGISGGLAVNNAKWGDDIDMFIVSAPSTLWLTRLMIIFLLEALKVRRRPQTKRVSNTICVNMIVALDHLSIPFRDRDLYSAHEVVQMRPLYVRGNTYGLFLEENRWVKEFLGNTRIEKDKEKEFFPSRIVQFLFLAVLTIILWPLEQIARITQLWYMKKRRTTEVIGKGYVRFHPRDKRTQILPRYQWRLSKLQRRLTEEGKVTPSLPLFPAYGKAHEPVC